MENYNVLTKRYTIYAGVLIFLFLILALTTTYKPIFFGLILGSIASLANLWSTYFQVNRLGQSIELGRAKVSVGTVFRFGLVIGACYIAFQYPQTFHFISMVIGLMLTYIIIIINSLFNLKHL